MSQVTTKSKHGKTILFGYDRALGFFFDKYNDPFELNPSLELSTLRNGLTKTQLLEQIGKWLALSEKNRLQEPTDDTEIEGEKCIVALCAVNEKNNDALAYPILIKLSYLKFPREFLGRINSILTFYGELLPIPLSFMGRSYKKVFLARAIAYLG